MNGVQGAPGPDLALGADAATASIRYVFVIAPCCAAPPMGPILWEVRCVRLDSPAVPGRSSGSSLALADRPSILQVSGRTSRETWWV